VSSEKIPPKAKQTALSGVSAGGDVTVGDLTQEVHIHEGPREKLTGIPNNSPLGTGKFVGRSGALTQLHKQLTDGGKAVVVGMGGLGKSELAIRYSCNHEADYNGGVCWINGRTGDVLTQVVQYCQLKLGMMLPEEKVKASLDLGQVVDWYLSNWRTAGPVLMVLDDVINLADCRPLLALLSSPRFRVLVTTRQPKLNADFYELDLELLSPEDALELLAHLAGQQRIETERDIAIDLCKTLGYLPLGIELVGRHLAANPFVTVTEVINSLSLESEQLRAQDTYLMANQRGVRAAFELSWQRLDETAQVLGQMLSLFAPGEIPWELVDRAVAGLEIDETTLRAAKTALVKQSLLQKNDQITLALHPLIQEFFENKRLAHADGKQWQQSYIHGLASYADEIPYVVVLEQVKQLTPAVLHLTALLQHSLKTIPDDRLEPLFRGVTRFYGGQAIYSVAQDWAEQGLTILQTRLGEDHPSVATRLNNLANLYSDQGRYSDAEPLFLQAIESGKASLGEDHPSVATRLNNLANLYSDQGRYSDAEPLFLQAIEIIKQRLGVNHPNFTAASNNLTELRQTKQRSRARRLISYGVIGFLVAVTLHGSAQLLTAPTPWKALQPLGAVMLIWPAWCWGQKRI